MSVSPFARLLARPSQLSTVRSSTSATRCPPASRCRVSRSSTGAGPTGPVSGTPRQGAPGSRTETNTAGAIAPLFRPEGAVVSLLACLELARRSALRLRQSAPFEPLWVYRAAGAADAA